MRLQTCGRQARSSERSKSYAATHVSHCFPEMVLNATRLQRPSRKTLLSIAIPKPGAWGPYPPAEYPTWCRIRPIEKLNVATKVGNGNTAPVRGIQRAT